MEEVRYEDNWPWFEKMLAYFRYSKINKYLKGWKPRCVDIGCGFNGRFLRSISAKIESGYGVDLRANDATYGNVQVINNESLGGKLPLTDGSIDIVFMLAVMEHLDDCSLLIAEGARVLESGGLFIATTPTVGAKWLLEFLSFKLHMISKESILEHKHYYIEKELRELFEKNGLAVARYSKFQFGFNQIIVGKKN